MRPIQSVTPGRGGGWGALGDTTGGGDVHRLWTVLRKSNRHVNSGKLAKRVGI